MVCRLFGAKQLPEPKILNYCQLNPEEQTSVKFESKYKTCHARKCIENIICDRAAILSRGRICNSEVCVRKLLLHYHYAITSPHEIKSYHICRSSRRRRGKLWRYGMPAVKILFSAPNALRLAHRMLSTINMIWEFKIKLEKLNVHCQCLPWTSNGLWH